MGKTYAALQYNSHKLANGSNK